MPVPVSREGDVSLSNHSGFQLEVADFLALSSSPNCRYNRILDFLELVQVDSHMSLRCSDAKLLSMVKPSELSQ